MEDLIKLLQMIDQLKILLTMVLFLLSSLRYVQFENDFHICEKQTKLQIELVSTKSMVYQSALRNRF